MPHGPIPCGMPLHGSHHTFRRWPLAALSIASLVAAAAGQTDPRFAQPQPVRPNLPGSPADEIGLTAAAPLIREGTFVSSSRGQAVKGKTGRWFFVFDPDAQGRVLPPMVLLPNLNLAAVERSVERNPPGTRMVITGVTTVYQNHNYLLLSAPPLLVRAESASMPQPTEAAPEAPRADAPKDAAPADAKTAAPTDAVKPAAAGEPSIDDIVAKLDQAAGKVAALAPQRTSNASVSVASAPQEPAASNGGESGLLAPGLLASRRGRIFRTPDSALVFALDNGTEPAEAAAPLILLPSQNLSALEQISELAGEGATYTMSGEIVTYRGRNYLLPRSYQANRTTDQVMPAQ